MNESSGAAFSAGSSGLISVIVPMYNVEVYIEKCVNSILESTYRDIEIVLVDDGSTDSTVSICRLLASKDSRIKIVEKLNGGVSTARNLGIEHSSGTWLCFVDADDWIDPEMLDWLVAQCMRHNADISVCGLTQHFSNRVGTTEQRVTDSALMDSVAALKNVSIMQGRPVARLFKRSVIAGIRFDSSLHYGEDWLFFCESIAKSRTIYYEPRPFYHQLINREGNSGSSFDNSRTYFDAAVKVQSLYGSVSESLGRLALIDVANAAASVCRWAHRAGEKNESIRYRKKAIGYFRKTLSFKEIPFSEKAKCAIRIYTPDSVMGVFHKLMS